MAKKTLREQLFASPGGNLSRPWGNEQRLGTMHGLSKQVYGVTGMPGRVPMQRSGYHGTGLGVVNQQPYYTAQTPSPQVTPIEMPDVLGKAGLEGSGDAPGDDIGWGKTPSEAMATQAAMGDVLSGFKGMVARGASKTAIAAYLDVPVSMLSGVAISSILNPAGFIKFIGNTLIPAGLSAKKHEPRMKEILDIYGPLSTEDVLEGDFSKKAIDIASELDPATYALEEFHVAMPSPQDAQKLASVYEQTQEKAKPYTNQLWERLKRLGRFGDRDALTGEEHTALGLALGRQKDPTQDGGVGDMGIGDFGGIGDYGYEGSMTGGDIDWW